MATTSSCCAAPRRQSGAWTRERPAAEGVGSAVNQRQVGEAAETWSAAHRPSGAYEAEGCQLNTVSKRRQLCLVLEESSSPSVRCGACAEVQRNIVSHSSQFVCFTPQVSRIARCTAGSRGCTTSCGRKMCRGHASRLPMEGWAAGSQRPKRLLCPQVKPAAATKGGPPPHREVGCRAGASKAAQCDEQPQRGAALR